MERGRDFTDSAPHTPVRMNCIEEEESGNSPPVLNLSLGEDVKDDGPVNSPFNNNSSSNSNARLSMFVADTPPTGRPNSFYNLQGENSSSSSLVATKGFTFGASSGAAAGSPAVTAAQGQGQGQAQGPGQSQEFHSHNKRHSFKYIPGPKLPPMSRTRSPVRKTRSPSPDRSSKRNSLLVENPFNFSSSTLQPPLLSSSSTITTANNSSSSAGANPNGGGSRSAMFRKGHRYKHSSVSMNFFQEPEVKEPLNIIKSLPVPDFKDLRNNLTWPKTHIQIFICVVELLVSLFVFQLGQVKEWKSLSTLSHFLSYDVLGGIFAILTELLSKFEIWKTGTITLPFGLNRIDVLLSFAFAISICFAGLDLIFHVLEEIAVLFAENSTSSDYHKEINEKIPHSHHTHVHEDQLLQWYSIIGLAAFISSLSYHFIFKSTQYKIKSSLITLSYLLYMSLYPILSHYHRGWDMIATTLMSTFISSYGIKVAKWTSTILLMGFSTTSLNDSFIADANIPDSKTNDVSEKMILKRSLSVSASTSHATPEVAAQNTLTPTQLNPMFVKSKIYDSILSLPIFKNTCSLKNQDLLISKVNFQLFIVIMRIEMKNGSNEEELELRIAVDKLIREYLPNVETTIEIERM